MYSLVKVELYALNLLKPAVAFFYSKSTTMKNVSLKKCLQDYEKQKLTENELKKIKGGGDGNNIVTSDIIIN